MTESTQASAPGRKSVKRAVLLQCLPMLGAASCIASSATNQNLAILPVLLWWLAVFAWGCGYWYLGRTRRAVAAVLIGPALALGSCTILFQGGAVCGFEHCADSSATLGGARQADAPSIETGLIIASATLIAAEEVWRLAKQQNLDVQHRV
jgi:hypothetical protein